jgi:transposase
MIDPLNSTTTANLVAIDIAKEWNVALIQESSGQRRSIKFANRFADYNEFVQYLHSLPGPVCIGLEPTGDFHRTIAHRLLTEGFQVVSISSLALARFREARFGNWDKNDPKDAQVMLAMMAQDFVQVYWDPLSSGYHDWQEISNTYFQVTLARTRLQHSLLSHHLPLYFPEFTRYWYSTRSEWFIRFLVRFPIPAAILALDREAFITQAWDLIGRKVSKRSKLEEIYVLAKESIGLPVKLGSPAVEAFQLQLNRYLDLNRQRDQLDRRAQELLAANVDFQHLKTLPGVGSITALTILAEAGDLRRFHHHRQFLKYCGLDLAKSQSGQTKGHEILSKRGNKRLRLAFWMAGLVAIRQRENAFRDKYERYLRATPFDADRKRKALTAVAAKMARVAYAVVKHGSDYQCFFEHRIPSGSIPLARAVEAVSTS